MPAIYKGERNAENSKAGIGNEESSPDSNSAIRATTRVSSSVNSTFLPTLYDERYSESFVRHQSRRLGGAMVKYPG
jgi:hypothetical protein